MAEKVTDSLTDRTGPAANTLPLGGLIFTAGDAESQLRAVLHTCADAVLIKDLQNQVVGWSRGAEHLYGYTPEQILGNSVKVLFPPDREAEADRILQTILRGERLYDFETVRVARDGRWIDVTLSVAPIVDAAGRVTGALSIAQDGSARKLSENSLKALRADADNRGVVLDAARNVALDILRSQTGVEALRHIADAARELAGAEYAALGVASSDATELIEFFTVGLSPEEESRIGPRPRGAGVLGVLLQRSEPLRIDRLAAHPASSGFPPNHPPMESFLGVPIRRGSTVLGSLYLTNKLGGGSFTAADEEAVQALGAHAAVAIHNLNLLSRQRGLVRGLISAQEEERRAVAYDLHDGLTQYVMASHAHLETFRHALESGKLDRAKLEMEQGMNYLKEAVIESRRLVNGLRLLALDDLGLSGALEQLVAEEKTRANWQDAEFVHNLSSRRFDKSIETAVYRVAQEALTNARKHASTTRTRMILLLGTREDGASGEQLVLDVRDWGQGFDVQARSSEPDHVGLQGIAERVRLMNGTLDLCSSPGEGTVLRALFPV